LRGEHDIEVVPERCDGCGRAAAACGMATAGWTVRALPAGFAGAYCLGCASALQLLPWTISCSECARQATDEAAAERSGFRYFLDGAGGLAPYCAECAARGLGS
jgi:hypothetical protein